MSREGERLVPLDGYGALRCLGWKQRVVPRGRVLAMNVGVRIGKEEADAMSPCLTDARVASRTSRSRWSNQKSPRERATGGPLASCVAHVQSWLPVTNCRAEKDEWSRGRGVTRGRASRSTRRTRAARGRHASEGRDDSSAQLLPVERPSEHAHAATQHGPITASRSRSAARHRTRGASNASCLADVSSR